MKWLIAALLALASTTPLQFTVHATDHTLITSIIYERDPANVDITVAVTALDHTPLQWASATVLHVLELEDQTSGREAFDDVWPRMPAGHYSVQVTLDREQGPALVAPPITVEVK
jgi:hypothetical protein